MIYIYAYLYTYKIFKNIYKNYWFRKKSFRLAESNQKLSNKEIMIILSKIGSPPMLEG